MRHSRVKLLILVNKPNDLDVCIKDSEHNRRNAKKTKKTKNICGTKNIVIRENDALPSSKISVIFSRISQTGFAFNSS